MKIYLAGPMRGHKNWNRDLFDEAYCRWANDGHTVFCPSRLVQALPWCKGTGEERDHLLHVIQVDFSCIYACEGIALLPGWEKSRGATAEVALGLFLGLKFFHALSQEPMVIRPLPWSDEPGVVIGLCPPRKVTDEEVEAMREMADKILSNPTTPRVLIPTGVNVIGPGMEQPDKECCDMCFTLFNEEQEKFKTLHLRRGNVTLCEACYVKAGNEVR